MGVLALAGVGLSPMTSSPVIPVLAGRSMWPRRVFDRVDKSS
jgi:hypothetical protein